MSIALTCQRWSRWVSSNNNDLKRYYLSFQSKILKCPGCHTGSIILSFQIKSLEGKKESFVFLRRLHTATAELQRPFVLTSDRLRSSSSVSLPPHRLLIASSCSADDRSSTQCWGCWFLFFIVQTFTHSHTHKKFYFPVGINEGCSSVLLLLQWTHFSSSCQSSSCILCYL